MRLENKTAIVVGGGQTPGETIGNGRATAIVFGREGARVLVADRDLDSAEETAATIRQDGGTAEAVRADIAVDAEIRAMIERCVALWGRIDILHNNVGINITGGDKPLEELTDEAFDRVMTVNLRGMVMSCKHAVPVMRRQGGGSITNISSGAAWASSPHVAYRASKIGVIGFTQQLAYTHAPDNIRANVILPGLMHTPMSIESRFATTGKTRAEIIAERDARVPLGHRMGTGWDVAYAALFLNSDEARFITGAALPVDGGQTLRVG